MMFYEFDLQWLFQCLEPNQNQPQHQLKVFFFTILIDSMNFTILCKEFDNPLGLCPPSKVVFVSQVWLLLPLPLNRR